MDPHLREVSRGESQRGKKGYAAPTPSQIPNTCSTGVGCDRQRKRFAGLEVDRHGLPGGVYTAIRIFPRELDLLDCQLYVTMACTFGLIELPREARVSVAKAFGMLGMPVCCVTQHRRSYAPLVEMFDAVVCQCRTIQLANWVD